MNPYLKSLRDKYASLEASIDGLQSRAAAENRDLSDDEKNLVRSQSEAAEKLYADITLLTEQENRNAAVASLAVETRGEAKTSNTSAVDRDPGHYRSVTDGGQHSFVGDQFRALKGLDSASSQRINEFARAQGTSDIAGVVPPKWLVDEFTVINQQGAALANATRGLPLADARSFTLPGQTASSTVANQPTGENGALVDGDDYDAAGATVNPSTIVGQETVSRQLLDASSPAIDQLIASDLQRAYIADRENRIGAAIRGVGSAIGGSVADFNDDTNAAFGYDLAVDAGMAVWKGLYVPATALVMSHDTFGAYLKLKDADGRPIVSVGPAYGPANAVGSGNVLGGQAYIAGMPVVVSAGMVPTDAGDWAAAAIHGPDVVWFESPGLTFRYEEVAGPQSIKIGLFRYFAVAVRQGTRAVKNILIDDSAS